MVGDGHETPGADFRAQRARGVGQEQPLHAGQPEGANGPGHDAEPAALIEMRPAAQARDGCAGEGAEQQFAGMAVDGAAGKSGQVGIGNRNRALDRGRQPVQPGSQHESDARGGVRCPLRNELGGGVDGVVEHRSRLHYRSPTARDETAPAARRARCPPLAGFYRLEARRNYNPNRHSIDNRCRQSSINDTASSFSR